ncbi:MAG: nucleotidyl transferase AbiEii/AbiGii toxin family protein [Deltaproteobacteria bacterium]|nr:nucleotidyl transferase AbiEii/AbiGii toxin family protein [Deltaproteobacteria bacterium]
MTVLLSGTKISFFQIPDPFLFERTPYRFFFLADIRDMALMKLIAISGRGSRKDFVDLHTILRSGPILQDYFRLLPQKYGPGRANLYHILKSLTYFEDAEQEPMPTMLEPFDWEECKAFFVREAHAIVLPE